MIVCVLDECEEPKGCLYRCGAWFRARCNRDHEVPGGARCLPGEVTYDATGLPVEAA